MTSVGKYSENLFYRRALLYQVTKDHADIMFNYLVYGLNPGSFFTSLLANDMVNCLMRSHPANRILDLKNLAVFLVNTSLMGIAWGSYENVQDWLKMKEEQRRKILEERLLIYSSEDEMILILKDIPLEPIHFF